MTQHMDRSPFVDLNLESFENFETDISHRFDRHRSLCEALARKEIGESFSPNHTMPTRSHFQACTTSCMNEPSQIKEKNFKSGNFELQVSSPFNLLNRALTELLCDYQWDTPDISSPVRKKFKADKAYRQIMQDDRKNYVFLISECPRSSDDISFLGNDASIFTAVHFMQSVMPTSLYHKFCKTAKIGLVWLDTFHLTSECIQVRPYNLEIMQAVHTALQKASGGVIPLQNFVKSVNLSHSCTSRLSSIESKYQRDKEYAMNAESTYLKNNKCGHIVLETITRLLLPFSSIASLAMNHPLQKEGFSDQGLAELVADKKHVISHLWITTMQQSWVSYNLHQFRPTTRHTSPSTRRNKSQVPWNKLQIKGTTSAETNVFWDGEKFLCTAVQGWHQNDHLFSALILELIAQNLFLVVQCSSSNGDSVASGVLCPLSPVTSVLTLLTCQTTLALEKNLLMPNKKRNAEKRIKKKFSLFIGDSVKNITKNDIPVAVQISKETKPFRPCVMENWFVPQNRTNELVHYLNSESIDSHPKQSLLQKLQLHYRPKFPSYLGNEANLEKPPLYESETKGVRRSPRLKKTCNTTLNISNRSADLVERSFSAKINHGSKSKLTISGAQERIPTYYQERKAKSVQNQEVACFFDESELLSYLSNTYDSSLKEEMSLMSCVQTVVSSVLLFIKNTGADKPCEKLREFLEKHFIVKVDKINKKYEGLFDNDASRKRLREYQLQALLLLEIEATVAVIDATTFHSVEKIIMLLRTMSFLSGPAELSKLLLDIIKIHYGDILRNLLIEIGEELNVPVFPELMSPSSSASDSPSLGTSQSDSMTSHGSVCSSISSTSMISHKDNKSRILSRPHSTSYLTQTKRQIVVPKCLLNKSKIKKVKPSTEKNKLKPVVSSSPLPSKKSQYEISTHGLQKFKNVRRNLFEIESNKAKSHKLTRRKTFAGFPTQNEQDLYNSRLTTPKGHHVLKTRFVAETPSPKQGTHALLRKQARHREKANTVIDINEVEESPLKPLNDKKGNAFSDVSSRPHPSLQRSCSFYASKYNPYCLPHSSDIQKSQERIIAQVQNPEILFSELLSSPASKSTPLRNNIKLSPLSTPERIPNLSEQISCLTPKQHRQLHLNCTLSSCRSCTTSSQYNQTEDLDKSLTKMRNVCTTKGDTCILKTPMKGINTNLLIGNLNVTPKSTQRKNCKRTLRLDCSDRKDFNLNSDCLSPVKRVMMDRDDSDMDNNSKKPNLISSWFDISVTGC